MITGLDALLGALRAIPALKALLDWIDRRRSPDLLLSLHAPYQATNPIVDVVDNGDRRQVVFGITLYNDGAREARDWKLWLASLDKDTQPHLDRQRDQTREYREETFTNGRWHVEILSRSPSDLVASHVATSIPGRHTLNFAGEPSRVLLDYRLDAAGMTTRSGRLCLDIDWATRKGQFRPDS
jgi:hypothetical protein